MILSLIYGRLFHGDFLNFRIIVELGKIVSVPRRYSLDKYFLLFNYNVDCCALNMKDIRLGVLFIYRYLSLHLSYKASILFFGLFFYGKFYEI
jgi:hypothetical protein